MRRASHAANISLTSSSNVEIEIFKRHLMGDSCLTDLEVATRVLSII